MLLACEECRDLVALDRIGQTPQGLLGGLGEPGPAQRQSEMLPGVLHRHHQALVVLLAIGGSRLQEISGIKVDAHRQRIGARRRRRGHAGLVRPACPP